MSEDLEAGAAPAESGDVAPVEAAAVEAAPTETEEPSSVEATEQTDPSLTVDEEAVEEAPVSFPSHEEFGWDDWDGSNEGLPEQLRGWGAQFDSYYQKKINAAVQDQTDTREIYEALMSGKEDPRVAKFETELGEWKEKHAALEAEFEASRQEYQEYQKTVEQAIEEEAKEYAEQFAEDNPDLFETEELVNVFGDLLEEGWILEHAAVAARLPEHIREVARQAKADGVPDSYALKLAQGAKSRPAKPRPGAEITAGAVTPARSSEQVSLPDNKPMSLQDFRKQVARNALSSKRR